MAVVLMYHSVGSVPAGTDIFDLHVGPERFREQMAFLARRYRIVPLDELYRGARSGAAAADTVALTFDDGYANNLEVAGPVLRELRAPATLFLCTGLMGRPAYWWDHLAQIVLRATRYPQRLADIEPGFAAAERLIGVMRSTGAGSPPAADMLKDLVVALWDGLRHLSVDRIYALVAALDSLFAPKVDLSAVRPLRAEEVRTAADVFTIGAHTITHPFLTTVDDHRLEAEISESRRICRELSGQAVDWFSYPFGDTDARVAAEVATHMSLACTVQEGAVGRDTDPYAIPRVQVPAWTADELAAKLAGLMRPGA